jgi:hypothetical protein
LTGIFYCFHKSVDTFFYRFIFYYISYNKLVFTKTNFLIYRVYSIKIFAISLSFQFIDSCNLSFFSIIRFFYSFLHMSYSFGILLFIEYILYLLLFLNKTFFFNLKCVSTLLSLNYQRISIHFPSADNYYAIAIISQISLFTATSKSKHSQSKLKIVINKFHKQLNIHRNPIVCIIG